MTCATTWMFWLELLGTLATTIAAAGVYLNNKRRITCFYLWIVSNTLRLIIHIILGIWSLTVGDLVFLLLAFHGWREWRR